MYSGWKKSASFSLPMLTKLIVAHLPRDHMLMPGYKNSLKNQPNSLTREKHAKNRRFCLKTKRNGGWMCYRLNVGGKFSSYHSNRSLTADYADFKRRKEGMVEGEGHEKSFRVTTAAAYRTIIIYKWIVKAKTSTHHRGKRPEQVYGSIQKQEDMWFRRWQLCQQAHDSPIWYFVFNYRVLRVWSWGKFKPQPQKMYKGWEGRVVAGIYGTNSMSGPEGVEYMLIGRND